MSMKRNKGYVESPECLITEYKDKIPEQIFVTFCRHDYCKVHQYISYESLPKEIREEIDFYQSR